MFDKLYFKSKELNHIESLGAYFITRIKKRVLYEVITQTPVSGGRILRDDTIRFTRRWAKSGYSRNLRIISFYSTEKEKVMEFITNNFNIDAATIALLYRYRWQIELFFKWIKQRLRIISFYGTSANAVMIQIYSAVAAYCMLAMAADAIHFKGSLYEFANMTSVSLTEKRWLDELAKGLFSERNEPQGEQYPSLFDFDNLLLSKQVK